MRNHAFDAATMGSKVESACRFVERTGNRVAIGAVDDAVALVAGNAGTQIVPGEHVFAGATARGRHAPSGEAPGR